MNLFCKFSLYRSLLVQIHCQYEHWTFSSFDYLNKQLALISSFNTFSNKPTGHFFESLCQWSLQSVLNIWNHTCKRKEEYLKENLTRCGLLFLKAWVFQSFIQSDFPFVNQQAVVWLDGSFQGTLNQQADLCGMLLQSCSADQQRQQLITHQCLRNSSLLRELCKISYNFTFYFS